MKMLIKREGRLDHFTRRIALLGFLGLLLTALATLADVLLRWLFSAPIEGFEDVSKLMFAVTISAFLPVGLFRGHNITIRFLGKGLGPHAERWLEFFGAVVTLTFFALVAWQFVDFAYDETINHRYTWTIEMPTAPWWWVVSAVIIACVPVQLGVTVVRFWQAIHGRADEPFDDGDAPGFLERGSTAEEAGEGKR